MRLDLIHAVNTGKMKPEEAEAQDKGAKAPKPAAKAPEAAAPKGK